MDPDVKKDASLEVTLCAHMLHLANNSLQRENVPMPSTWSHHTDNATSEGKNQIMAKYSAYTTHAGYFKCAELTQNSVGHTHNEQDQRHSEGGAKISKAKKLDDPDGFLDALKTVNPIKVDSL